MSQTVSIVRKLYGPQAIQFKDGNQWSIINWIEERGGDASPDHINKGLTIKVPKGAYRVYNMDYIVWNPDGNTFTAYSEKRYNFLFTEV